jgi:small subunit ribosomal protein S29e/phospholipase B1
MYFRITIISLLLFVIVLGQPQQKVFQNTNAFSPFTLEWTEILQQMYNTLGNKSKENTCLFPVPTFHCTPFYWNDQINNRDAYHLRPNVISKNNCQ